MWRKCGGKRIREKQISKRFLNVGLITNNDTAPCRRLPGKQPQQKEMLVDSKKQAAAHSSIDINGNAVERVSPLNFLQVALSDDLKWTDHATALTIKAPHFLRHLQRAGVSTRVTPVFPVETILLGFITFSYDRCSQQEQEQESSITSGSNCSAASKNTAPCRTGHHTLQQQKQGYTWNTLTILTEHIFPFYPLVLLFIF